MYVDTSTLKTKGKTYTRHLLRESFRENGKVKHRTIANVSECSEGEISAIKLALRHKEDLSQLGSLRESLCIRQGASVGAVWTVFQIAKELGVVDALGPSREGKLALWQVIARVIDQGSRLSAVRLASSHAACDILGLEKFDEDDLYENLTWLSQNQSKIEDRLFQASHKDKTPSFFLYDVTSSYFEGEKNELAAFGYNRDGKKGKRQIVIGLLCDEEGVALSIEVFVGNTQDPKTVSSQIKKVVDRFGGGEITFVGDSGMIKSKQILDLKDMGFHYITAITKPQIESLLCVGIFQMSLFDEEVSEVKTDEGERYILRKNPHRAKEIEKTRESKYKSISDLVAKKNTYLESHRKADPKKAHLQVQKIGEKLKIGSWIKVILSGRQITIDKEAVALEEIAKLDGCYVLKTDLKEEKAPKELIHARYKDLTLVEKAFRTEKTVQLEVRPIYLRRAERTKGHVFVVMLAYRIVQELSKRWQNFNLTVEEALHELTQLCLNEVQINNSVSYNKIPQPREMIKRLIDAAHITLPTALPSRGVFVSTKKKLQERRKVS